MLFFLIDIYFIGLYTFLSCFFYSNSSNNFFINAYSTPSYYEKSYINYYFVAFVLLNKCVNLLYKILFDK